MEQVYDKYNQFQSQCHSERDIVKIQDLNKQIYRLQQFQLQNSNQLLPSDKKYIQKYINIYRVAIREIQSMKKQFTMPSLLKQKLAQIFDNQKQQLTLQIMQKTSELRDSQIQIPSFKAPTKRQNVIDVNGYQNDLASPALRRFFDKKSAQINSKATTANFKSVLQTPQNGSFARSNNNRSISRQQPSQASRSSASSFKKKPTQEAQLKTILEENKKIKAQYDKKLKRQLQLSEFQKNLLKDEKNRYMLKIEQLQGQLQKLYRANYRLKEQMQVKQKTLKDKIQFDSSASFRNVDQNIVPVMTQGKDYYQPYVMKTKHNDLKKLNMKCQSEFDGISAHNRSDPIFFGTQFNNNHNDNNNKPSSNNQQPVLDILGNQLQKQLQQMQKSKSNQSQRSSKKWSRDYNPDKYAAINNENDDFFRVLKDDDEQQEPFRNQQAQTKQAVTRFNQQKNNNNKNAFQMNSKNPFQKKQDYNHQINILPPTLNVIQPDEPLFKSTTSFSKRIPQQQTYNPSPNYSFTKTINRDYSLVSNQNNYDTFEMTKTFMNLSQNEESQTNKYIDPRTSTRNKVAFFKDSLILIKNQNFQLAFKKSSLVQTKDRVRVIFFVKNKTNQAITINLRYQYDASYFKLKVNEKLQTVPPFTQARQDLQVYAYSTLDLNQVIDIMVNVDFDKFGLWMPILWMQFNQNDHFKLPDKNEEISIIPDRQFKNYQTAKTIMPLMFGGQDGDTQWAYLYGVNKFGPCFVKLIWQGSQLKIQTNAKWIDLLAFVMHHVK